MAGNFQLPSNQATPSFGLKKTDAIALDFEKLDKKELKTFLDKFKRKKMTVKNVEAKNTAKRANGVLQKDFTMEFQDGQKIQIFVKGDGAIFQVKLNKKVIPIRNTTNLDRAVEEMVGALQKNASAFDRAKMLRQRRSIRPPKPRINTTRKQKIAEANNEIQSLEAQLADLKAQLAEVKGRLDTMRAENEDLSRELTKERNTGDDLQKQIDKLIADGYTLPGEEVA